MCLFLKYNAFETSEYPVWYGMLKETKVETILLF